ncbi:MAG TPA: serine hydrolase domain-containing protein [Flavisolibacter sp.]|jgi:CubicO group peptidase (beta-lactamase class C family)|nr:serine hydrolase domain-containing protein [Flavisolibacter sp.]
MSAIYKNNCLKASLVAVFMLFLQDTFAQGSFTALDQALEENKKLLGKDLSVVVVSPDTVLYQKYIGDVQPKTPFPIGASSQWLTTALIMQLVDEGKLSLDDKVSKYLPIFDSYRKGYITIRICLSHQTGIGRDGFKVASLLEKTKYNTLEEAIPDIAKKDIHANAGEQFRFSNYGMIIVARIAEIVTKKRFEQIVRTKLFVPLGMRNTTFVTDDGSAPNPANGAKSTAADYAKFLQMLLNGGKAGSKQVLSEAAVQEMRKVQIRTEQITQMPKTTQGFTFSLGSWAVDNNTAPGSQANVLTLPNFNGSWPMIDFNRKVAMVVLAKEFSGEQQPELYLNLKTIVDKRLP